MLTLSPEEEHILHSAIFLPLLIHVLENDRERMLSSQHLLKKVYLAFSDELLRTLHSDLRVIKKKCYQKHLRMTGQVRDGDMVSFHCTYQGYVFQEPFTLSAMKGHILDRLSSYLLGTSLNINHRNLETK